MRSVAVANQKGGVGKTTTAIHLAHGLTLAGQRVALVDLDPQGNASVAVQSMVTGPAPVSPLHELRDGLWLLPSVGDKRISPNLKVDFEQLSRLRGDLESAGVDWLVVDCPPRMDEWGWAGLRLCQEVLVPVPPEFFPMHGLSQMMRTLSAVRADHPGCAKLMGVLVTLFDTREKLAHEVVEDLSRNLGDKLMDARIYRDSALVEAASHGASLFDYRIQAKGARSYVELVREVLCGRPTFG